MSKEIESISSALFDKIRTRFSNVTLGNESAKACSDPEKARFFNFTYTGNDGAQFGNVTISLIDETSLKVYFGQNISGEMDREQRKEWYEFLRNLRLFAKRNLLTFDTRDINKSNLELQDVKQQAKTDNTFNINDIPVTESKLYGTPGRPYNSFADKGATKILIRHKDKINDEVRGSRARQIQEIFLETDRGERFLLNHTNLGGAYAMAEHLNAGGTMHDAIAEHINGLVAEMASMKHFVRSTKHRQFEDKETADMTRAAVHHYDEIKRTLRRMRGARGFRSYFENWVPEEQTQDQVDVNALRERFVKKIYDDRFTEALPIVYNAYKKHKAQAASKLGDELAEWADTVSEGTWSLPDTDDEARALQEILKTPLLAGIDGIDATNKLYDLIGDDELFDNIYHYSESQGPDADVRPLIKVWLQNHMPELLNRLQFGQKNVDDAGTNHVNPVSPSQAQPHDQHGATGMDEPVTESDDLAFLRSLAGLVK
ncbi:hypothetical protein UFOVP112_183 [uncultured Caudovirales phage]|uniref:Uncharacterized protein n=1 Tax=uncultured Caudovirales phage TaxID=2100421 RepID=A0A6J5L5C8_9CAUD|nr:hypothetical protein UFOVP112_183 [uncultured Caudovirales phage]